MKRSMMFSSGIYRNFLMEFLLSLALILIPLQAHPLLFNTPVDFVAPTQSLWGPGGSGASFGSSGSTGVGILNFGYSIGASSGTVSARFPGEISVDYISQHSTPGVMTLGLSFLGDPDGGNLKSDLGAWVKVGVSDLNVLDEGYALNIDQTYTPRIDQQVTGSDSTTVGNAGVDALFAEVGADFDIEQTDRFAVTGISGILAYSLLGSSDTHTQPFSLLTDSSLSLNLELPEVGTWDLWFEDLVLNNWFAPSFDAELVLYEEHISGTKWCEECAWGVCVPYPCGVDYDRNELTLADINVFDGSAFPLEFENFSSPGHSFSIEVAAAPGPGPVPEPDTLSLMTLGFLSVAFLLRRSKVKKL